MITASTEDATMMDVSNATATTITLLERVKSSMRGRRKWVDDTELKEDDTLTTQLRLLKETPSIPVSLSQTSGEAPMFACDLGGDVTNEFLNLDRYTEKFYIRAGYDGLFDLIMSYWKERTSARVTLIGNAGTGKSWYQIYVLHRLLRRKHDDTNLEHPYKFVVRHVGDVFFLIDLKKCTVYHWSGVKEVAALIIGVMDETLYFYEPAHCKEQPPLFVGTPSLTTLSPYEMRICEYRKAFYYRTVYFWPWSWSESTAMAEDSQLEIQEPVLQERYRKFGGIVRHLLAPDVKAATQTLRDQLANVNMSVFQNVALNVDRTSDGNNVSGYLVCYNCNPLERRFTDRVLEYTSEVVEDKIEEILDTIPLESKMQTVLNRLNNWAVDLSGKCLEAVATEFLRRGTAFHWETKQAGSIAEKTWSPLVMTKRKLVRLHYVHESLRKTGEILAPTNPNFPLVDIVLSCPNVNDDIVCFQFTWNKGHPFSIRAMYDLRVRQLRLSHETRVVVYIVSPGEEAEYAAVQQDNFLIGDLQQPFKWSKKTPPVQPNDLQTMRSNTTVAVVRPRGTDWKTMIDSWLANNRSSTSVW